MRKILVSALGVYRKAALAWLRVQGKTAGDVATERVLTGQAWDEFCDTLKAAGATLQFPGTPKDSFSQAEGYRYLSRLTRAGLEAFMEYSDPLAPALRRMVHETVKMGADNPDNYYQNCVIDGQYDYKISGTRGTVAILSFATQAGHYGQGEGMRTTSTLDASDLNVNEDGSFELVISASEKPGNWLPMETTSSLLIIRQTFLDRDTESIADLSIKCLHPGAGPQPLTPQKLDQNLKDASTLVAGASLLFAKWARDFQASTNELPLFDPEISNKAGGDPNITYYHSHWALKPDQALVIETMPPECEHWNFQLNNYWMESLDYRYFTIHTNKHLATYNADGSVTIVIAHQDPGHPNWINTVGHELGTMSFRWVGAQHQPQPATRVVSFADIPAFGTK